MRTVEEERDRLKGELQRVGAQLIALESVLSTNEHLVLRSPFVHVLELGRPPPWDSRTPETWRLRLSLIRQSAPYDGQRPAIEESNYLESRAPFLVPPAPRLLVCLLPSPREPEPR